MNAKFLWNWIITYNTRLVGSFDWFGKQLSQIDFKLLNISKLDELYFLTATCNLIHLAKDPSSKGLLQLKATRVYPLKKLVSDTSYLTTELRYTAQDKSIYFGQKATLSFPNLIDIDVGYHVPGLRALNGGWNISSKI